jgi:hypothetical protein
VGEGGPGNEDAAADVATKPPDAESDAEVDGPNPSGDAGTDGATPPPPPTSVIFVHASPNLEPLRLCWSPGALFGPDVPFPSDAQMPSGNYPGIPVGGAVWLNDPGQIASLQGATLYAVRARPAAIDPQMCSAIIANRSAYTLGLDYWPVGRVPAVFGGGTEIVAIVGCRYGDMTATAARCGTPWDPVKGNLRADVVQVGALGQGGGGPVLGDDGGPESGTGDDGDDGAGDGEAVDATSGGGAQLLAVQAAHLSPALQQFQGAANAAAQVSFGPASGGQLVAELDEEGDLRPTPPLFVPIPSAISSYGLLGFSVDVPDAGPAGHVWMSLAQAQQLVSPTQDPTAYFGAGGTYVVVVVGDPNAPHAFVLDGGADGGGYDGTGLHVLVLPTALQ